MPDGLIEGIKRMNKKLITESKGVELYKRMLNLLGAYCDLYPATSVDNLLEVMVEKGIKTLPSDKRALDILSYLTCPEGKTTASVVHSILNTRFGDLPVCLKPVTKTGRRDEVAFWCKEDKILDKVRDLLNFAEEKGKGFWSDAKGEKVQLLDTEEKEE